MSKVAVYNLSIDGDNSSNSTTHINEVEIPIEVMDEIGFRIEETSWITSTLLSSLKEEEAAHLMNSKSKHVLVCSEDETVLAADMGISKRRLFSMVCRSLLELAERTSG